MNFTANWYITDSNSTKKDVRAYAVVGDRDLGPQPPVEMICKEFEDRLVLAKQRVVEKKELLRTALQTGVRVDSLDNLADTLPELEHQVGQANRKLANIKTLLELGFEPTNPPTKWYVGWLKEPKKVGWFDRRGYPQETWPGLSVFRSSWERSRSAAVFTAPIPVAALAALGRAMPYLDDVRAYSPRDTDFTVHAEPVPHDPVIIGAVEYLGERIYFEIARWDINKDLAEVYSR